MVADDQMGGSQAEDPLPSSGVLELASAGGAVPVQASPLATDAASIAPSSGVSSSRVPLWDRLPRSIWLMSVFALCQ